MKTLTKILFALLLMTGPIPAIAQHQHDQQKAPEQATADQPSKSDMMHGGMMHQMQMQMAMMDQAMQDPFKHSTMMVQVLPTMKVPLGLSDQQVSHLEAAAKAFKQQQSALQDKAHQAEENLKELLASDKPDPAKVKLLLRETGTHHADLKVLGFETAFRMKADFTKEQRAKLSEMTPMETHHHMATHMTMMEMMQALQGDMMQAGMMEMKKAEKMDHGKMKK